MKKPWEQGAVIPSRLIGGVVYVDGAVFHEVLSELVMVKKELREEQDERGTIYLSPEERERLQVLFTTMR